jgi:RNA polymerase sigma-70 factor, ECF subfamily
VPAWPRSGRAEQEAARVLFVDVYPKLAGWAAAVTGRQAAGHDVASEAFTRLLRRWTSVSNPEAYLWMTATNLVRDHWRDEKRDRALQTRLELVEPSSTPGPDASLTDLVARLPARLRLTVTLFYFADLPVRDIAAVMQRPEGSVKRWLSEARVLLAAQLEERHVP